MLRHLRDMRSVWRRGQLNTLPGLLRRGPECFVEMQVTPRARSWQGLSTDLGQLRLGYTVLPTCVQGQEAGLLVGLSGEFKFREQPSLGHKISSEQSIDSQSPRQGTLSDLRGGVDGGWPHPPALYPYSSLFLSQGSSKCLPKGCRRGPRKSTERRGKYWVINLTLKVTHSDTYAL